MKPKKISILVLLLLTIGGLVTISISVVLLVSSYVNLTNTRELLLEKVELTVDSLTKQVQYQVLPIANLARQIAILTAQNELDIYNDHDVVTSLKSAIAAIPQLSSASIIRNDGSQVLVNRNGPDKVAVQLIPQNANSTIKTHLDQMKSIGTIVWNPPFRNDGKSFISVSMPLQVKGKFSGILAVAITLIELSNIVEQLDEAETTVQFILYGKRNVIAHPKLGTITESVKSGEAAYYSLKTLGDPVLKNLARTKPFFRNANLEIKKISRPEGTYIVLLKQLDQFGQTPWTIGTYILQAGVNTQMKRLTNSIAIGAAFLLLSLLIAILLARRIASPVKEIAIAAKSIGQFKLSNFTSLPGSRILEFSDQSFAINHMVDGLRQFETYVPKSLVKRLMMAENVTSIESIEREMTVMFTDIVGFTHLSENLPPSETAELLNNHFEILNKCIENEGGTLDKYIGDAVMAFWGAPEIQDDHASRACRTALAINQAMKQEKQSLQIKIAIHTGPLIVGNIGAKKRMNYTIIGDTVNTCSRIEKIAGKLVKDQPATIVISAETKAKLDKNLSLEFVGDHCVKGRSQSVSAYLLSS